MENIYDWKKKVRQLELQVANIVGNFSNVLNILPGAIVSFPSVPVMRASARTDLGAVQCLGGQYPYDGNLSFWSNLGPEIANTPLIPTNLTLVQNAAGHVFWRVAYEEYTGESVVVVPPEAPSFVTTQVRGYPTIADFENSTVNAQMVLFPDKSGAGKVWLRGGVIGHPTQRNVSWAINSIGIVYQIWGLPQIAS